MAWKRVCDASEVGQNVIKKFNVDGIPVLIANYGSGFRAFPPSCPHMEEPLDESGIVARGVLTCTKHLWAWDLRSLEIRGSETEKPLKTYDLKEEKDQILVFIDKELVYEFDTEKEEDEDFFGKD